MVRVEGNEGQSSENENATKVLLDELAREVQVLRQMYGLCKSIYIVKLFYSNLTKSQIAKLFNTKRNVVTACISNMKNSKAPIPVPLSSAPTINDFREVCRGDAYSVGCQLLEAEIFMYAVAREALPVVAFWDVFVFARTAHRTIFNDVYNYFISTSVFGSNGVTFKMLLRAVKRGERWYVGTGILAYVYILLDMAIAHKGFYGTQWSTKVRSAIKDLTSVDPLSKDVIKVLIPLSHFVISRLGERLPEIEKAQEEVYMAMTRKTTL